MSVSDSLKSKKSEQEEYKPKIRIKVRAYDHKIIDQSVATIIETIKKLGAKIKGPILLPTEKKRYTVLRSSFVHKDHRDQFETRIHKRLIEVVEVNPKIIESLTQIRLPSGVNIEIKT